LISKISFFSASHSRSKRDILSSSEGHQHADGLTLNLAAQDGNLIVLDLFLNRDLIPKDYFQKIQKNVRNDLSQQLQIICFMVKKLIIKCLHLFIRTPLLESHPSLPLFLFNEMLACIWWLQATYCKVLKVYVMNPTNKFFA